MEFIKDEAGDSKISRDSKNLAVSNERVEELTTHTVKKSLSFTMVPVDDKEKLALANLRSATSPDLHELLSDDDYLRFLRARKHEVPKAIDMITKWEKWWNERLPVISGADRPLLPRETIHVPDPNEHVYRELLPHANIGHDKEGRPCYWEKTGLISSRFHVIKKKLSEDDIFVRHVRQQELMVKRLESATQLHGKPINKQVIVMDLKNLSMTVDLMALRAFKRTLSVDEACYPERLHMLFFINAPMTFTALWSMVKPWIDPLTVQKFKIVGSNYQSTLKEYIAEDMIPVEYGGTRDFHWTFPENLDDSLLQDSSVYY